MLALFRTAVVISLFALLALPGLGLAGSLDFDDDREFDWSRKFDFSHWHDREKSDYDGDGRRRWEQWRDRHDWERWDGWRRDRPWPWRPGNDRPTAPIPEPSTYALAIAGGLIVGYAVYRKRD